MAATENAPHRSTAPAQGPSPLSPTAWGLLALGVIALAVLIAFLVPGIPAPAAH